jgi:hypothetical protein
VEQQERARSATQRVEVKCKPGSTLFVKPLALFAQRAAPDLPLRMPTAVSAKARLGAEAGVVEGEQAPLPREGEAAAEPRALGQHRLPPEEGRF